MENRTRFPLAPPPLRAALRLAPPALVGAALTRVASEAARTRPSLFRRLGEHASAVYLIDPNDLPIVVVMRLDPARPVVEAFRRADAPAWDVRVAGPLSALIAMVHAVEDSDALFFSRDVIMEGGADAAVALRNALDSAEIDVLGLAAESFGPPGRLADAALRPVARVLSRLTGVALVRPTAPDHPGAGRERDAW